MNEKFIPHIIPRQDHPISRRIIDPDALKVLYRLRDHGFMGFLVGGCVRDLLLGKTPKDFDVATEALPQQLRGIFRNSRLIGHRFRLVHVYFKGPKIIEVSTFRRRSEFDGETGKSLPRGDNTYGTPAEDAFRRDITINGIFYNIADFSLVDYVGGLEDLQGRIIRCIGDPEEKFTQDPVRMIRVIRHAARTGFPIENKTYQSLMAHVDKLSLCSPSRMRAEFWRELREGSMKESMRRMIETGMLFVLFPAFFSPLQQTEVREYFLKIAAALDDLVLQGKTPSEEFCYSLFLLPFVRFYCPLENFPAGWKGQSAYHQKVKEWVMAMLGPLQFTRRAKEGASYLLASQRIFRIFLPEQRLPFRFLKKPYFSQAHDLFKIDSQARGEALDKICWKIEETKHGSPKKKRKRRSPKRAFFTRQDPS